MITVTLQLDPAGFIRRFTASGHAGLGDPGSDIICAAISAIATTAIGSLQDLAGLEPAYQLADGLIDCQVPAPESMAPGQRQTAGTLLAAMALGCRQIQDSYGEQYVKVVETILT